MRLNIKYKLFITILSAHFLVYLAMYSFGYFSFNRGFLDYIRRIEERQVPALVNGLVEFYGKSGTWDELRNDNRKWVNLIRQSIESSTDPSMLTARQNTRPTPGGFSPNDWYYTSEYSPARPYLHLLNADQSIIFGNPDAFSENATLFPITAGISTVGYLAVTSRQQLSEQADLLFAQQQQDSFLLLALLLICLSALIAFPAASFFTRPVRDLVAGTRALTSGDYGSRLHIGSSDELGQLGQDFNTLAFTLEQNRSARQQWIADISHELRTPLSILQGELESVQDGIRPLNTNTLDSLHHEVLHLSALVNDLHLLSLSDLGALVYEKRQVNLKEVLEHNIEMHAQVIAKLNIKIKLQFITNHAGHEITMLGDEIRLLQLLDNLMQNTCRYTDSGGQLHVLVKENNAQISIEWEDSAPGVSGIDMPHLFDRLYRVDTSRNRVKGGSGLGLAICKNIVHAHEGSITASHSVLGGLKHTIIFPIHTINIT